MPKGFPSSPEGFFFAIVLAGIMSAFFSGSKNRSSSRASSLSIPDEDRGLSPEEIQMNENVEAVKKVVAEHEDCTAEVFNISVHGRRWVETFRLLTPGRKVELRMKKGEIKVFAYGEYMTNLFPPEDSNLPRLFKENIPFEAYLGGRDSYWLSHNDFDSCSIIVFYKLDGVPPTKVNLF